MRISQQVEEMLHPQLRGRPNAIKSELISFVEAAQHFKEQSQVALSKGSKLVAKTLTEMENSISIAQNVITTGVLDESAMSCIHINDLLAHRAHSSLANAA